MEDLQKNDLGRSFISGMQAGGGRGPGLGLVVRSFTGFYEMPINLLFTAHTVFSVWLCRTTRDWNVWIPIVDLPTLEI
jgi:hypothetical protein